MKLPSLSRFVAACALGALLFSPVDLCWSSPMTTASKTLGPALANVSLDATLVDHGSTVAVDAGFSTLSASDLFLGSSSLSGRVIPFRHGDMAGLAGTALLSDIFEQPDRFNSADTLSIFAGLSVPFGDEVFILNPASGRGQGAHSTESQLALAGSEDTGAGGRLLLVGAGLLSVFMLLSLTSRSKDLGEVPPAPVRKPIAGRAWVQRGTTFNIPNPNQARSAAPEPSLCQPDTRSAHRLAEKPFLAQPASSL